MEGLMEGPTRWAYVLYSVEGAIILHQRFLIGRVAFLATSGEGTESFMVMTADGDLYDEDYSGLSPDIQAVRYSSTRWPPPAGLPRSRCYRFASEPRASQVSAWTESAREAAGILHRRWASESGVGASRIGAGHLLAPHLVGGLRPPPGPALGLERAFVGASAEMGEDRADDAVAAGGALQAGAGRPGGGEVWVSVETRGGLRRGGAVGEELLEVVRSDRALLKVRGGAWVAAARLLPEEVGAFRGLEAAGDARLGVVAGVGGRQTRQWREAVAEIGPVEFLDFAIPGPRSVAWCSRFLDRKAGGPRDHHKWWKAANRLSDDMWGVVEHSLIMQALDLGARFDALDIANLACFELLARKAQMVEYSVLGEGDRAGAQRRDRVEGGRQEGAGQGRRPVVAHRRRSHLPRTTQRIRGLHGGPDLMEYVSKEVEREASIMKQVRKAREERHLARQGR